MEDVHAENIANVIGSPEPTYMWQICSKIFTYNTSDALVGQIDVPCRNWFIEAFEHCSDMIFLRPEPKVHTWLFLQMMNLRYYIFPRSRSTETSMSADMLDVRMRPEMLTKSDCSQLFLEAAKDYIEIAPRYSLCVEDNFHYAAFLKMLFGMLTVYLMFVFARRIFKRKPWTSAQRTYSGPKKLSPEEEVIENRKLWLSDRSLSHQKFEVNHFRVEKGNVKKMFYDPPTIAIKVKKKQFSEALCSLVTSDPIVEEQRNGLHRKITKSRGYALHKLNLFLNRRSYCRLILDIGYDDPESDSDMDSDYMKRATNFSAGDQIHNQMRYNESTLDESVDTSSIDSVNQNHGQARPRRYCSKYKQIYLQNIGSGDRSVSGIPTAQRSRNGLTKKESSNSVSILHRKDSLTLMRKSSEIKRTGRKTVLDYNHGTLASARTTKV